MVESKGNKVRGFRELVNLRFQHFKKPIGTNIVEILKVISFFLRWVTDHDNVRMFRSSSPDGWTIEFYLYFFDLLDENLLRGVEAVRISGKVPKNINSTFIDLILNMDCPKTF